MGEPFFQTHLKGVVRGSALRRVFKNLAELRVQNPLIVEAWIPVDRNRLMIRLASDICQVKSQILRELLFDGEIPALRHSEPEIRGKSSPYLSGRGKGRVLRGKRCQRCERR